MHVYSQHLLVRFLKCLILIGKLLIITESRGFITEIYTIAVGLVTALRYISRLWIVVLAIVWVVLGVGLNHLSRCEARILTLIDFSSCQKNIILLISKS